jgi:hypothetical protein
LLKPFSAVPFLEFPALDFPLFHLQKMRELLEADFCLVQNFLAEAHQFSPAQTAALAAPWVTMGFLVVVSSAVLRREQPALAELKALEPALAVLA